MKCNYKRSWQESRNRALEKQQRERDDWFNGLSKEKQEAELKRRKEDLKETFELLSFPEKFCSKLGIKKYY